MIPSWIEKKFLSEVAPTLRRKAGVALIAIFLLLLPYLPLRKGSPPPLSGNGYKQLNKLKVQTTTNINRFKTGFNSAKRPADSNLADNFRDEVRRGSRFKKRDSFFGENKDREITNINKKYAGTETEDLSETQSLPVFSKPTQERPLSPNWSQQSRLGEAILESTPTPESLDDIAQELDSLLVRPETAIKTPE